MSLLKLELWQFPTPFKYFVDCTSVDWAHSNIIRSPNGRQDCYPWLLSRAFLVLLWKVRYQCCCFIEKIQYSETKLEPNIGFRSLLEELQMTVNLKHDFRTLKPVSWTKRLRCIGVAGNHSKLIKVSSSNVNEAKRGVKYFRQFKVDWTLHVWKYPRNFPNVRISISSWYLKFGVVYIAGSYLMARQVIC